MQDIKYVVVGTPRAATAYMAELLSNLGLACGHEKYFKFEQRWQSFLESDRVLGDATWLAVPFLSKLPPEVRILHQTRDPLNVIRSLLQVRFLDLDADGTPVRTGQQARFTQFAYGHCPQLLDHAHTRERAMWFYYYWNRAIDLVAAERAVLRYDIESFGPDRLKQILAHIGVPRDYFSDELLTAHFEVLPRNINAKVREKVPLSEEPTWPELPEEVRMLAASYGYGPPHQSKEHVEGWNQDAAVAQSYVRRQARTVLQAWRVERSRLTDEVGTLRETARRAREDEHHARQQLRAAQQELTEERLYRDHRQSDGRESAKARRERDYWMCRMVADGRVLDVCCGSGARCILLGREGLEVVGTDGAADTLVAARQALDAERDSVKQFVRFTEVSPLAGGLEPASFGTVILADALTRVSKPERLLERVLTYLVEGGRLVVSVPLGYHPDQDRVHTFYMRSLLKLLRGHCQVSGVEVLHDYACVLALKPSAATSPEPPAEEALTAWERMGEETLIRIQRRWLVERANLSASNVKLTQARDEAAGEVSRVRSELLRLQESHQRTQGELERTKAQQQFASEVLWRAQALQLRLARSNAQIPDDALAPLGARFAKPVQKSGGFLFFCVNGAGLGHVTRSLAVARRIRRIDPAMPIYFLSSSQALQAISREGMIAYYVPPRSEYGDSVGGNVWNKLLLQHLRLIVGMHGPAVLVYDGVSPYPGLLDILPEAKFVHTAMVLRLRHKHNRLLNLIDQLERFDQLIFPGEPGVELPPELGALNHRVFDPIIYLDPDELLTREEVRRHWSVPPGKKVAYIQLGAGNINDVAPWVQRALAVLEHRHDVDVVLAESPVANAGHQTQQGVRIFTQYPNSLHFRGFDLAITAAGYNTFHELMHFGVPTIFVPNQKTMTDDQVARALTAQQFDAAKVVLSPAQLDETIPLMLRDDVVAPMRANAMRLVPHNGAVDVAQCLLESAFNRLERSELMSAATPLEVT